jgi:hypothetical protein
MKNEIFVIAMDYFLANPMRRPALKQVLKKHCTTIPEEDPKQTTPDGKLVLEKEAPWVATQQEERQEEGPEPGQGERQGERQGVDERQAVDTS